MRITEASERLGISARMLRYRESLGLLPAVRGRPAAAERLGPAGRPGGTSGNPPGARRRTAVRHRQFGAADLDAAALGLKIEQRYDVSPAALAFALRVLADPTARAEVAELGRRIGRIRPLPAMALDFEKERALRLLDAATTARPGRRHPPSVQRPAGGGPGAAPGSAAPA
jgi:MerR family copper efflux transcriptional regulator